MVQKITHRNHILEISKCCGDFEKGQGHKNLIKSFPHPNNYLCKFGQNPSNSLENIARKISYADVDANANTDADGIHAKNNKSLNPSG